MRPKVSVLMSVHNGQKYLKEAVDSILNQTYTNFEFLIIDDKSSDSTLKILQSFNDQRIKVIKNKKNLGLTKSLNLGLKKVKGDYVARMDCDDISLPERFKTQVDFLDKRPLLGLCGNWVEYIDPLGRGLEIKKYPTKHEDLLKIILRYNPFKHPSLMIRKSVLLNLDGYDEKFKYAQDYDLVLRLGAISKVANIPKVLLKYRIEPETSISFKNQKEQEKYAILARLKALRYYKYPIWESLFLIKPLIAYLVPSSLKIFLLKTIFWKIRQNSFSTGCE